MLIKLINYGGKVPERAHYNDAGADVFASIKNENKHIYVRAGEITKIPLGFGLNLPDGFAAFVLARSGKSTKDKLTTEVVPIDSGYTGEVHAIVYNANAEKDLIIKDGDKIAQLVIVPVMLANFTFEDLKERGGNGFGSTDNNN